MVGSSQKSTGSGSSPLHKCRNKDKLSISCKLQLLGIYILLARLNIYIVNIKIDYFFMNYVLIYIYIYFLHYFDTQHLICKKNYFGRRGSQNSKKNLWYLKIISSRGCKKIFLIKQEKYFVLGVTKVLYEGVKLFF